jgi:hypothetical protein
LEVFSIKGIELIHDHRFQQSSKDKEAVRHRYNKERLSKSYERMIRKYGIEFDHDWQWWTENQIQLMTERPWVSKLKYLLNRFFK